jgi:hypothetical protein
MDHAVGRAGVPAMSFEGDADDLQLLGPAEEGLRRRKAAVEQRCDTLLERIAGYQEAYQQILLALQGANQKLTGSLTEEILHIKRAIPRFEKKTIKRIKLVGILRDLHKQTLKINVKPELARKNDLYKIDDFLIRSFRTLNYLNTRKHLKMDREED